MGYRAFFSYARADDRVANWLHRQLDSYRTPKPLVGSDGALGPVPAKLHPIFRDRTDLQAGGHIDGALQQALEDSECLVVLCTPTSAKSHWVNHEVETFLKLGREARIFPVIAAGEPDSGDAATECFPPALRGKGLLAADLREIKRPNGQLVGDGRDGGRLKLIAGLLGVRLDALAQRERRRQRMLVGALGAAALVFAGVAALAVVQTFTASAQRDQARNSLARIFAERSWNAMERSDFLLAARYALAGWRAAPANEGEYRVALGRVLHLSNESRALRGHEDIVESAAFSPDGTRIVTASGDATARVWDAASGREIAALRGHEQAVTSAAFSPVLDSGGGTRIVTASWDKTARVWDAASGREIAALRGHQREVVSAAFSPDGTRIVTASWDSTARVWDAASGREIAALRGHEGDVSSAAFSPVLDSGGGTRIVTASWDSTARVWDAASGRESAALRGHEGEVWSAAFSPDGTRIVTASLDRTARVWDASRLTQPMAVLAHAACTNFLSPQGRRFSELEIAADPLIRDVWLRDDQPNDRDVCEGSPGTPPLPAG